jgi:hypothetical protein
MSDQATIDANSAASAEDVMMVVDGVNDIATGWANFAVQELQHNADDPCYREIVLLDRRDAARGIRGIAETLAGSAALDLQGAIRRSLLNYWEDSVPGVWGFEGFTDWLIDRNVLGVDPTALGLLFGGPIGAAAGKDIVRDHLPLSSSFIDGGPDWNPPAGKGTRLRPGVYVYAPGYPSDPLTQAINGRLQGNTIRREWWLWKHWIEATVSGFARPLARWELRQLTGGGAGELPVNGVGGFTARQDSPAWVWVPGDPIDPDSIVGNLQEQERQLERLIAGANVECKVYRRLEQEQEQWERGMTEQSEEDKQETRGGWQRIAVVGIASLALVAAVRGKR